LYFLKTNIMSLILKRMEVAHRSNTWETLGLSPMYTYNWFLDIQKHIAMYMGSEHSLHAIMSICLLIAQEMSRAPNDSMTAILNSITKKKAATCAKSLPQVIRRIYTAANLVWYQHLAELPHPVAPPRLPHSLRHQTDDVEKRVFSEAEVKRIVEVAPSISPYADALVRLLFSTGLRIGAAAQMQWDQILRPDGEGVQNIAIVREKGKQRRVLLLLSDVQVALFKLARCKTDQKRVFPLSVRQLRNIFYKTCRKAGIRGSHCHPHTARHTLVHKLFAAGNSVALIAKFLGHRTVHTTERYYLRLSFEETMQQMRLPWCSGVKACIPFCDNKDATNYSHTPPHNR
jgi:integrase